MKILKKGDGPKTPIAQIKCHECDTVFECSKKEGRYVPDWRDGDYYEIDCPNCHRQMNVAASLFRKPLL